MSQIESSIPDAGSAAPPPAPAPVSSPPASAPAPAPAAAESVAPGTDTAASATPGAAPRTQEEIRERFETRTRKIFEEAEGSTQPEEAAPEAPPAEIQEPEVEAPVEAAPAEPEAVAPAEGNDLETILTAEAFKQRYPRHNNQQLIADVVAREAHRGELVKSIEAIGGKPGLELAQSLNTIYWKDDPTDEDAEAVFDKLVDPEHGAGAISLVRKMSTHFITTGLYDDTPSNVKGPDGKPIPVGALFASDLISKEWGTQPDGKTPYDLSFVDSLLKMHKQLGVDPGIKGFDDDDKPIIDPDRAGKPYSLSTLEKLIKADQAGLINHDLIDAELAGKGKPEPTDAEKAAVARAEAAEAKLAGTAEEQRQREEQAKTDEGKRMAVYSTQATGYVSRHVMKAADPLIKESGWAPQDGDSEEVKAQKIEWADITAMKINAHLKGSTENPNPAWQAVQNAIKNGEAFDSKGYPTPRFTVLMTPLETMAKAKFTELKRTMGPALRFAPTPSAQRNARLAQKNGSRNGEQPTPPAAVATPPRDPNKSLNAEERQAEIRRNFEAKRLATGQSVGVL